MNVRNLGHVKIDDPQRWPVIVVVVIVTVVFADTSTVDDRKVGWLAINGGLQPEVLLPV